MNARVSKTGEVLVEPLTRREREILVLLAQGYSAAEIARQLTLALSSVKWYVQQVYGKLGVNNKQRAIIRAGELGLLETNASLAYVPFSPKHNLPSPLTSFIGREKEIETVKHLLAPHGGGKRSTPQSASVDRLLTLTGAGGSGKTRLALQVAYATLDVFPEGVWFIDFAPLTDPALLPQCLLTTLGLSEQADRSTLAIVSDFLQSKRALLILDNCEHLIQACAQLAETLLRACPTLHILATSREALSVSGESLYLVPTLTTPDPVQAKQASLSQYEAVQLFVERAQTALPGFELTADNTSAVAQVCHQLDGIPLALELAAARLKTLRVEQIAARLEKCFDLLSGGSRTALPRHQTLHALIDWSHDLLSDPERVLFRRLGVFAGGWTLEAAEAICVGDGVEGDAVLDLMTHLGNKSLILAEREQGQEARYRMLETIRQYARGRLLEAGEDERVRVRHFEFFLQYAERGEPKLRGPLQLEWLSRTETEIGNLRIALEWSLAQADRSEMSLRLVGALLLFWQGTGLVNEGRAWLARALANPAAPSAGAARAKALCAVGTLAHWQGDLAMSRTLLEESACLWRALGSVGQNGLAHALTSLGDVMRELGDTAMARSMASEATALFREQNDRWGLASSLSNLGMAIRDQEDFALANSVLTESVALWRDLGDLWGLELATLFLGLVAMRAGDYEAALRHFGDRLAISRKLGNEHEVAWSLTNLGSAALCLENWVQAKACLEESYRLFQEAGDKYGIAESLYFFGLLAQSEGDNQQAKIFFEQEILLAREVGLTWLLTGALMGLAGVAAASGPALRAARLLGAAEAQLKARADYWNAFEKLCVGRATSTAMAQLGEAAFAAAQAEGWAMTFEQAVDYALETEPSA